MYEDENLVHEHKKFRKSTIIKLEISTEKLKNRVY